MNRDQLKKLENDLWSAADKLRANSDLKASEYSTPVLGLIFLKFADNKYRQHEAAIEQEYQKLKGTRRERSEQDIAIEKCGFYLKPQARYDYLLNLPEKENIAKAIRAAMASIENTKTELLGVLPQEEYDRFTRSPKNQHIPKDLLKLFSDIPVDASGDVFGQIYEYFLANFALSEGQGGGEFFTPRSVVKLMTEIIEPHGGKVFDPACGSGGMFVQSADFILQHQTDKAADLDVFVCGTEKTLETVKLAKMNLAVNNLRGDIKQANTYYEDPFNAFGAFDYVMANPPFNVDDVTLDAVEKDRRFNTYGVPRNKTKAKAGAGNRGAEPRAGARAEAGRGRRDRRCAALPRAAGRRAGHRPGGRGAGQDPRQRAQVPRGQRARQQPQARRALIGGPPRRPPRALTPAPPCCASSPRRTSRPPAPPAARTAGCRPNWRSPPRPRPSAPCR